MADHLDGTGCVGSYCFRYASEKQPGELAHAMGTHHDQFCTPLFSFLKNELFRYIKRNCDGSRRRQTSFADDLLGELHRLLCSPYRLFLKLFHRLRVETMP